MNKIYAIEKSPFFRMQNRRKLAVLLNLDKNYFKNSHEYKYRTFSRTKPNGDGLRTFMVPPNDLKKIQKRILKLFNRIETPQWLMSGKKSCSYITNAEVHKDSNYIKTMDISKFFDSVKRSKIYKIFSVKFKMSDDISWIMTSLVTNHDVLPTGSSISQTIGFWAYEDMFNEINNIAKKYKCNFSLYVDDMTFSSNEPICKDLRNEVDRILKKNGLHSKLKKDHYYQIKDFKLVTGVGIRNNYKIVPNKRRKEIIELFDKCKKNKNINDIEKLEGALFSLRQIEPNIFPEIFGFINHYQSQLKALKRFRSKDRNNGK